MVNGGDSLGAYEYLLAGEGGEPSALYKAVLTLNDASSFEEAYSHMLMTAE